MACRLEDNLQGSGLLPPWASRHPDSSGLAASAPTNRSALLTLLWYFEDFSVQILRTFLGFLYKHNSLLIQFYQFIRRCPHFTFSLIHNYPRHLLLYLEHAGSLLVFTFNGKHNLESSGKGETCGLIIFAHCVLSSFLKLQISLKVFFPPLFTFSKLLKPFFGRGCRRQPLSFLYLAMF